MVRLRNILKPSIIILILLALAWPASVSAGDNIANPEPTFSSESTILISELQTRGTTTDEDGIVDTVRTHEFIELYNTHDEPVSLHQWQIEFLNKSHDGEQEPTRTIVEFVDDPEADIAYEIPPKSFFVISYEDYLNTADYFITSRMTNGYLNFNDGAVRLINQDGEIVDLLGYGSPETYLGSPAPTPEADTSIYRCQIEGVIVNTDNNMEDFYLSQEPKPGEEHDCPESPAEDTETDGEQNDNEKQPDEEVDIACKGVVFSELLPNPEGPRSVHPREDNAFIELYNPTEDFISLSDCGLQTSASSKIYWFENVELAPEEYRAFYERETQIMLPVNPSGTAYLLDANETELESVTYPEGMPEGAAWAWFGNNDWRNSFQPSPNEVNIKQDLRPCPEGKERNPETNRCRNIDSGEPDYIPCGPNQERNPETNRCRLVESASSDLKPCGPGRERNPETNRCRNIDSGPDYVPCGPNQERNPETNRCRLVESASSDLVPCGPNQERNPETNRCRRVAASNEEAIAGVRDVEVVSTGTPVNWWLAGVAALLAIGYGLWEWRYDVGNFVRRLRNR